MSFGATARAVVAKFAVATTRRSSRSDVDGFRGELPPPTVVLPGLDGVNHKSGPVVGRGGGACEPSAAGPPSTMMRGPGTLDHAMLLTITTTHRPATDLGYLLHKHPGRFQSYDLSFGRAHTFYPEATEDRCTACLLLDVDPVGIVRGKGSEEGLLAQYVNDRPYAASSFLSVAISQVFGSAL